MNKMIMTGKTYSNIHRQVIYGGVADIDIPIFIIGAAFIK